jgi:blue light- and temperature-responsive anti-repressor
MNSEVYKILYCSKNLIEGENAERDAEVGRIFQSARRNNSELKVTGALFFNSAYFAQVLEGPKLGIEKIFEDIQRDPRHGDVIVLSSETGGPRDFPEWSMAHVAAPDETTSASMTVALDSALSHPGASADGVLSLLRSLVIQEE